MVDLDIEELGHGLLLDLLCRFGLCLDDGDAVTLRRAGMTLQAIYEQDRRSPRVAIVRGDDGAVYMERVRDGARCRIFDTEEEALQHVKRICDANGMHYAVDRDLRSRTALYVAVRCFSDVFRVGARCDYCYDD
jgi:hypothetical protein